MEFGYGDRGEQEGEGRAFTGLLGRSLKESQALHDAQRVASTEISWIQFRQIGQHENLSSSVLV